MAGDERLRRAYLVKYHDRILKVDAHNLAYAGVNNVVVWADEKCYEPPVPHQRRRDTRVGGCGSRARR